MDLQEFEGQKGYRVHLYAVVRVAVDVTDATSQLDAIARAEQTVDLASEFRRGEFADEVIGILVDEVGDSDHTKSQAYKVDANTGAWTLELPDPQVGSPIEIAALEEEPGSDAPRW